MSADVVELSVPADPAYVAVVRTATAGLGVRLELTLDQIDDLRIAVDEACALLLPRPPADGAAPDADPATSTSAVTATITARFTLLPDALSILVTGPATRLPGGSSIAWSVLEALAGHVESGTDEQGSWIRLVHPVGAAQ